MIAHFPFQIFRRATVWQPGRRGLLALLPALAVAAEPPAPASADMFELPPFEVKGVMELPPPEKWRYAQTGDFEVLSNASDSVSAKLVRDFQQFRQALAVVWPPAGRYSPGPRALILSAKNDRFSTLLSTGQRAPNQTGVTLTVRNADWSAIALDLQTTTLVLPPGEDDASGEAGPSDETTSTAEDDTTAGEDDMNTGGVAVEHHKQLYREYLRLVLARIQPRSPAWLEEGLTQIFMRIEFSPAHIVVGRLEKKPTAPGAGVAGAVSLGRPEQDFNISLAKRRLMPMADLLSVTPDSPIANRNLGNLWSRQCYAFVHYGFYGDNGSHQKAFLTFVSRLAREPLSEALFKECFGRTYAQFTKDLRSYIEFTPYKMTEFRAPKDKQLELPPLPVFRDATESESGRIKGDTLLAAGHLDAARMAMLAPYRRGERDPALFAALGLYESALGDAARGRRLLEASARANVARPRVYLELARFRLAEERAKASESAEKLRPEQIAPVFRLLSVARTQPPPLLEVYELVATTWALAAVPPTIQDLKVIDEGVRLFRDRADWIHQAALLKSQFGFYDDAAALVSLGRQVTRDPSLLSKLDILDAQLHSLPVK